MIPTQSIVMENFAILLLFFIVFVVLYTDTGGQIIAVIAAQVYSIFFLSVYVYEEKITSYIIFIKLFYCLIQFLIDSLMAIILLYIASLHSKMASVNVENLKLLDGMHEGLLILSKPSLKPMFCNRSA